MQHGTSPQFKPNPVTSCVNWLKVRFSISGGSWEKISTASQSGSGVVDDTYGPNWGIQFRSVVAG